MKQSARDAEEAAARQDTRTICIVRKTLRKGRAASSQSQVKNRDGVLLTKEE